MNRRFLWAFVLALILPVSQVAAAVHDISQACAAGDKAGIPAAHCDLCDAAGTVAHGGATSEAQVFVHEPQSPQRPAAQSRKPRAPDPAAFFLCRAPPSAH